MIKNCMILTIFVKLSLKDFDIMNRLHLQPIFGFLKKILDNIPIKGSGHNQRSSCKKEIIKRNRKFFKDTLTRKSIYIRKKILWNGKEHIFIKKIEYHIRYSSIILSSMNQN